MIFFVFPNPSKTSPIPPTPPHTSLAGPSACTFLGPTSAPVLAQVLCVGRPAPVLAPELWGGPWGCFLEPNLGPKTGLPRTPKMDHKWGWGVGGWQPTGTLTRRSPHNGVGGLFVYLSFSLLDSSDRYMYKLGSQLVIHLLEKIYIRDN